MLVVFNFICSLESYRPRTVTKDLKIGLNYEKSWLFKLWCCSRRTHASLIILMKIIINHTEYMYILFCIRNPSSLNIGLYILSLICRTTIIALCLFEDLVFPLQTLMVVCISFIINNHSKLLKKKKMHTIFGFILIFFIDFYSNNIISDYFLVKLPAIWFLTNKICINK